MTRLQNPKLYLVSILLLATFNINATDRKFQIPSDKVLITNRTAQGVTFYVRKLSTDPWEKQYLNPGGEDLYENIETVVIVTKGKGQRTYKVKLGKRYAIVSYDGWLELREVVKSKNNQGLKKLDNRNASKG